MKKLFPEMYDRPETIMSISGLAYGFCCFLLFPYVMMLFSLGTTSSSKLSWIEVVYHVSNFAVAVSIFGSYLKESFFNVQFNLKGFLTVSGICAAVCLLYAAMVSFLGVMATKDIHHLIAQGALPLVEVEQFNLTVNLVCVNPVIGVICVVFLAPLTISCLYYATAFAPVCCSRPWLASILVAVAVAVPRICNALTFWPPKEELALYLVQLPLHLIACVAYQKTDTIWAPIAVHTIANAAACVAVFAFLGVA